MCTLSFTAIGLHLATWIGVNCADIAIVKASFGKKVGQSGFDPRADVNGDRVVNVLDLSTVARRLRAGTACR